MINGWGYPADNILYILSWVGILVERVLSCIPSVSIKGANLSKTEFIRYRICCMKSASKFKEVMGEDWWWCKSSEERGESWGWWLIILLLWLMFWLWNEGGDEVFANIGKWKDCGGPPLGKIKRECEREFLFMTWCLLCLLFVLLFDEGVDKREGEDKRELGLRSNDISFFSCWILSDFIGEGELGLSEIGRRLPNTVSRCLIECVVVLNYIARVCLCYLTKDLVRNHAVRLKIYYYNLLAFILFTDRSTYVK